MNILKQLKSSVWVMALIGGVLIIGSIIVSFGIWDGFYRSPFLIIPVIAFSAIMIWCIVRFPLSIKKIGFFICHIGLLVIVVCAFLSSLLIKDTSFAIPVNPYAFYGEVDQEDGTILSFGFDISVASFEVEKYEADYCLYDKNGNVLIDTVIQDRNGVYDLGEYGTVSVADLKRGGEYVATLSVGQGMTLAKLPEVDKSYKAELQIWDGDEQITQELGVNDPYVYKGWKFYLMGYDQEYGQYVNLYVKKDPANIPFAIGIWMVITGTFLECFPIQRRKEAEK